MSRQNSKNSDIREHICRLPKIAKPEGHGEERIGREGAEAEFKKLAVGVLV
jgi:hypothetical protein